VTARALDHARAGGGPSLLEFVSYRFSGQYEGDPQTYQPPEEIARWRERDPLATFERRAAEWGLTAELLDGIEREVSARVDAAFAAAERAPFPEVAALFDDVYVSYP